LSVTRKRGKMQKLKQFNWVGSLKHLHSFTSLSFSFPLLLNFFLVNTTWTPTQGWYLEWGRYIAEGDVPYKDFYIPFPPLFAYVNRLFLFASDPLLAERIFMTLLFSLLASGLFKLLTKFFSSGIAFISSMLASLVFQFSPTNTIAGYYEFSLMFACWGLYFTLSKTWNGRFFGGVCLVASSLTKQNFIALVAIVVIMEIFLNYKSGYRHILKNPILVSIASSYSLFTIYLLMNQIFLDFVGTMIQGGGKNPNAFQLLKNLAAPALNFWNAFFTCLIILALFHHQKTLSKEYLKSNPLYSFLLTFLIFSLFSTESDVLGYQSRKSLFLYAFIWLAILLIPKGLWDSSSRNYFRFGILGLYSLPVLTFIANEVVRREIPEFSEFLHKLNTYSVLLGGELLGLLLNILILFILVFAISILIPRFKVAFYKGFALNRSIPDIGSRLSFILAGLIVSGLLNAFNGGFEFSANLLLGAIALACFINYFKYQLRSTVVLAITLLLLGLSSIQIGLYNYQWFGWNEANSVHPIIGRSQIEQFRNFRLTEPQIHFYEEVQAGIALAKDSISKSNLHSPKIVTFPMQPIITEMSELPRYKLNCPILHFDICPDDQAQVDLQMLRSNPADIVVLFDLGSEFILENERVWRSGNNSTYSKIQDYLLNGKRYIVIYKIRPDDFNLSTVYILAKK